MGSEMLINMFDDFLASSDNLRVYRAEELLFTSEKKGILPLVEYAVRFVPHQGGLTVYDMVVGNAAALLLKKIGCCQIFAPLGSEFAAKTLRGFGIDYHFIEIVPSINNHAGDGMCPMEELSLDKNPEEFYQACLDRGLGEGLKP